MTSSRTLTGRLRNELRARISGDLLTAPEALEAYSRTQGWYKITPIAVLLPKTTEDIQFAVRTCTRLNVPVIPRGAGTGLAGHAIGFGLVVDLSRFLTHAEDREDETVYADAGTILNDLNLHLRQDGCCLAVDPTSGSSCTIGGMIGTNASGWHHPLYGSMKNHIVSIRVVLHDGSVHNIGAPETLDPESTPGRIRTILEGRLRSHAELIQRMFPDVPKNSSGYDLPGALAHHPLDLRSLITGSEGTLCVVAGATLRTQQLPGASGGVLCTSEDLTKLLDVLTDLRDLPIAAAEVMDSTYAGMGNVPAKWLASDTTALLYLDFLAEHEDDLQDRIESTAQRAIQRGLHIHRITTPADRDVFFAARRVASERINARTDFTKVSFIDDAVVPLHAVPEYVGFLTELLSDADIPHTVYGHAADGNIHCAPFMDIRNLDHYRMIDEIAFRVAEKVRSLGGTLSGEHGDGFVRTPFLERTYGPDVFSLFRFVKDTFDPDGIFHPGIITGPQNVSLTHDISFE